MPIGRRIVPKSSDDFGTYGAVTLPSTAQEKNIVSASSSWLRQELLVHQLRILKMIAGKCINKSWVGAGRMNMIRIKETHNQPLCCW